MQIEVRNEELIEAVTQYIEGRLGGASVDGITFVRRTEKNGGVFALCEVSFGQQQTIEEKK